MVKFEKLNPSLSSPSKIPFYGEAITARWAYEALAVYQFKENKYERQFYHYDKIKSQANFKRSYWQESLMNELNFIENHMNEPGQKERIEDALLLLRSEISHEMESNPLVKQDVVDDLTAERVTPAVLEKTKNYISTIKEYNNRVYNRATEIKDSIETHLADTDRETFLKLKRDYANDKLTEFVKNTNETVRSIPYKGKIYQKIDPVYFDPESPLIKAHFYAPRKQLFGKFVPTFWVNIIVIWFMTIVLYVVLYFRLLKKLLDSVEQLSDRFAKGD